ncbi:hypothetical protein N9W36_00545 [Porticoccaceae bacterium]|nr:hypothetical protein [Porticoccaceae bacterium]
MKKSECRSCGKVVMASTLEDGKCWSCTNTLKGKTYTSIDENENQADKESSVGNSSQSAINILGTVNTISALCGVVVVLGSFLLWLNQGVDFLLFGAVAFGLLTLVIWAVNRVFIGIAEDVKGIRQKLEDSN